jgi:hypothetical protein
VLVRYYPLGLVLLLLNEQNMQWHMERRRLARGILVREEELKVRRQRLKELGTTQELDGPLLNERREVKRVRRSIRRLKQRVRELDQQAQSGRNDSIWRLWQRLGQGRAKASRR